MATAIRVIYALAIGIFVVMTIAFGIVSFYEQPERPEYPRRTTVARPLTQPGVELSEAEKTQLAEWQAAQEAAQEASSMEYDAANEIYEDEMAIYSRNALALVTLIGLVFIVGGMTAARALDTLRIGLMVGGLGSLLWGLGYAASDAGSVTMFIAALLALVVLGAFSHPGLRARLARTLRLGDTDEDPLAG